VNHFIRSLLYVLTISLGVASINALAAEGVPMNADHWLFNGNATFATDGPTSDGVLEISKGSVEVKDLVFADGTIEFDMSMPDHGILGMRLRAQNRDNAEALYFRPQKDCSTSSDCLQYMPLEHGAFEWDLFPEFHTLAWNHFRVVVMGRHMLVYVNHASEPTLNVDHMEGGALSGALIFGGPARYANLVITPARPSSVAAQTVPEPDDGFLRRWQISTASVLPSMLDTDLNVPTGLPPPYAAMPSDGKAWRTVTAQTKGLLNFSREVGSAKDGAVISLAWAKTTVVSERAQLKTVRIGWVREIWVYVNGALVFAGRNIEALPAAKAADQRISLENGTFQLPLKEGENDIVIALDDNLPGNTQHFGWGMEMKLEDLNGILLAPID
jgi:hypothetical protein